MYYCVLYQNVLKKFPGFVRTAGNLKCLWLFQTVSWCFTLFLNLFFSIEFVVNRALLIALNLTWITHFWCKFLDPPKATRVNVVTFCISAQGVCFHILCDISKIILISLLWEIDEKCGWWSLYELCESCYEDYFGGDLGTNARHVLGDNR